MSFLSHEAEAGDCSGLVRGGDQARCQHELVGHEIKVTCLQKHLRNSGIPAKDFGVEVHILEEQHGEQV